MAPGSTPRTDSWRSKHLRRPPRRRLPRRQQRPPQPRPLLHRRPPPLHQRQLRLHRPLLRQVQARRPPTRQSHQLAYWRHLFVPHRLRLSYPRPHYLARLHVLTTSASVTKTRPLMMLTTSLVTTSCRSVLAPISNSGKNEPTSWSTRSHELAELARRD